jgi:vacuolar protein sorting-associated protein 35
VFPDEFHLATLESFLQTCTQLKEKVNVRSILENMMDRLSGFGEDKPSIIPPEIPAFKLFNDCIKQLLEERSSLTMAEMLKLHKALLNFALKCYGGNLQYVNHCLGQAVAVLNAKKEEGPLADDAVTI